MYSGEGIASAIASIAPAGMAEMIKIRERITESDPFKSLLFIKDLSVFDANILTHRENNNNIASEQF
jgi:hypothetical protein